MLAETLEILFGVSDNRVSSNCAKCPYEQTICGCALIASNLAEMVVTKESGSFKTYKSLLVDL